MEIPEEQLGFKALILKVAVEVLEQEKILKYSDLVQKIVIHSERIRAEIQRRKSAYFLHIYLSKLVKQGYLVKVKADGDNKHTYITLPKYATNDNNVENKNIATSENNIKNKMSYQNK